MPTNPDVYPITAKFEKFLEEELAKIGPDHPNAAVAFTAGEKMKEVLGEYEHGTADVEDLFPENVVKSLTFLGFGKEDIEREVRNACLEIVRSIYEDLFLSLVNQTE